MACQLSYSKMGKACNQYTDLVKDYAPNWYLRNRQFQMCNVRYMNNGNGNCVVMGKVNSFLNDLDDQLDLYVQWWAANGPTQTCSHSGFCLPYPNEQIAFQDTSNYGIVPLKDKKFVFSCGYPSSYYKNMGSKFVKPQIKFRFCDQKSKPVSKIYVLSLPNFQDQPLEGDSLQTQIEPDQEDYQKPQWEKLMEKGLTKPEWIYIDHSNR